MFSCFHVCVVVLTPTHRIIVTAPTPRYHSIHQTNLKCTSPRIRAQTIHLPPPTKHRCRPAPSSHHSIRTAATTPPPLAPDRCPSTQRRRHPRPSSCPISSMRSSMRPAMWARPPRISGARSRRRQRRPRRPSDRTASTSSTLEVSFVGGLRVYVCSVRSVDIIDQLGKGVLQINFIIHIYSRRVFRARVFHHSTEFLRARSLSLFAFVCLVCVRVCVASRPPLVFANVRYPTPHDINHDGTLQPPKTRASPPPNVTSS